MDILIIVVIWTILSLLCIRCINKDKEIEEEWIEYPIWARVLMILFVPFIYMLIAGAETFKK